MKTKSTFGSKITILRVKRIFTLPILLLILLALHPQKSYSQGLPSVNIEVAKTVAINYCLMADEKYAKADAKDLKLMLAETKKVNDYVLFYVFNINENDGFIIVSGNINVTPVLCYVPQGNFSLNSEFRPPAFNDLLETYANQIEYLLKNKIKEPKVYELWNAFNIKGAWDIETMVLPLTTKWNQTTFFNFYSPQNGINGHPSSGSTYNYRCPSGCVATAMGQIINYYKWPESGVGSHSYNDPANPNTNNGCGTDPSYSAHSFYNHNSTYNFANMVDIPSSINYEISKLLYNCAVSVDMDFAFCATWANTFKVAPALRTYFDYSNSATDSVRYIKRSDYTDEVWIDFLKNQIRKERPVQYRGTGSNGGHSWVCYGYKTISGSTTFMFNFGWGGSYDGFYDIGSIPLGFNSNQGAVINIFPSSQPNLIIQSNSVSQNPICRGEIFTINFSITNDGTRDAGSSVAECYLSGDQTLDKNDTRLTNWNISTIEVGNSIYNSYSRIFNEPAGTYYLLIEADTAHNVHESNETDNLLSVEVSVSSTGIWIGGTNNNWEEATNWCGGNVPTGDVEIPSGAEVHVTASSSTPSTCHNININTGGSLIIDEGKALTVSGSITNNGTLNLNSDAGGIASLLVEDTSPITGTNNIQLYLTGGGAPTAYKWHYISLPVPGVSVDEIILGRINFDLAKYNEGLVTTSQDDGWVASDGYVYYMESIIPNLFFTTIDLGKGYSYYYGSDQLYTINGSINSNAVSVSLDYDTGNSHNTDIIGFNLIGNPFTCTLDWDVVATFNGLPKTEVSSAIYFTKDYTIIPTYIPGTGGTDGGTNLIPPMQAFFVDARASGQSITLPVTAKTHSTTARFKGETESVPLVRLLLEDGESWRDAIVSFNEKAELSFDNSFDAYKLSKSLGTMNLWTRLSNIDYAINCVPFPETSIEIPVGIHAGNEGTFTLRSNELKGLDNYSVTLKDKTTNIVVDLKKEGKLSFSTSAGEFEDRFVLIVTNLTTGSEEVTLPENAFNIYAFNGILNIVPLSDEWSGKQGSVIITDLTGKRILDNRNIEFWKNTLIQLPVPGVKGIYFVGLNSGKLFYIGKVLVK
jgi:hypothetical protein